MSCIDVTLPPETLRPMPLLLVAAVALIDADGRVLLTQRPEGKALAGFWEFPGGKLEAGESPVMALIREVREELGIGVGAGCLSPLSFVSHAYDDFHLLMPLYACRVWTGMPQGLEGQALAWVHPRAMDDGRHPLVPADIALIQVLRDQI